MGKNVKSILIAAFILLNAALVKATPPMRSVKSCIDIEQDVKIFGDFYLNKTTDIIYSFTSPTDIPKMEFYIESRNVELTSGKEITYIDVKANTQQNVRLTVRVMSSPMILTMGVTGYVNQEPAGVKYRLYQVLIDSTTGLFGEVQQKNGKLSGGKENKYLLSHYDCISGEWTKKPYEIFVSTNRELIRKIKKLEPSVTDTEALCLHADGFKVGMPYEDESEIIKTNADEEKQFKYYLDNGWLKAFRSGKRNDWIEEFKANANKSR